MRRPYGLTNDEIARIESLLDGRARRDAMPSTIGSSSTPSFGSPARERFGKSDTVYQQFNRWAKKGRW
jgi:hypothetical protein